MLASLLVGCGASWEVEADLPKVQPQVVEVAPDDALDDRPVAGWDPWRVTWDDAVDRMPVILLEDGWQAPMAAGFASDVWAPSPALPVGVHTIEVGEEGDLPFEVGTWGQVDGFDPAVLEGRAWRIVHLGVATAGIEDVLLQLLVQESLVLQVAEVRGRTADVSVWVTETERCQVFGASADVDTFGRWAWTQDHVEIQTSPDPISAWDMEIGGGSDAEGSSLGGVYAHLVVDTAPIAAQMSDEGDPAALCDLAGSLGAPCAPCPEGDSLYCLTLDVTGAQFEEVAYWDGDVTMCGVDLTEVTDVPALDCDIDLDLDFDLCALLAFPFTGATLSAALRRRRKG